MSGRNISNKNSLQQLTDVLRLLDVLYIIFVSLFYFYLSSCHSQFIHISWFMTRQKKKNVEKHPYEVKKKKYSRSIAGRKVPVITKLLMYKMIIHATLPLPAGPERNTWKQFQVLQNKHLLLWFSGPPNQANIGQITPAAHFPMIPFWSFYIIQNSYVMTSPTRCRSIPENLFVLV